MELRVIAFGSAEILGQGYSRSVAAQDLYAYPTRIEDLSSPMCRRLAQAREVQINGFSEQLPDLEGIQIGEVFVASIWPEQQPLGKYLHPEYRHGLRLLLPEPRLGRGVMIGVAVSGAQP